MPVFGAFKSGAAKADATKATAAISAHYGVEEEEKI